jgi:hypothetical protein
MISAVFTLLLSFQGTAPSAEDLGEIPGPPAVPDQVVEAVMSQVKVERWGEGDLGPKPPQNAFTPEELRRIAALKALNKIGGSHDDPLPSDPDVDPASIVPTGPPTNPGSQLNSSIGGADSDFVIFDQSQGAAGLTGGWPVEPSVGTSGRVVAYCGNTYGLLSTDGGDTFSTMNPNTLFGGNICCDQVMYYDRRHEVVLWLMQGARTGTNQENVYVVAFAVGMEDIANQNFSWFTIDPQTNGGQAAGVWWDFPEMTVSNEHMWFTTNNQAGSGGSVLFRISLDDIIDGDGNVGLSRYDLSDRQVRLIQGATTVMYGACHVDNNTQAIWRTVASESTISRVTRDIDAWQNGTSNAPGPDGNNWFSATESSLHKIRGAACTSNELFFFWTASEGGGFSFPYWSISRFSRNDSRTYIESNEVWSSTAAWAYASGHINDRGDLGGTVTFGG